jgi:hypothetical protein
MSENGGNISELNERSPHIEEDMHTTREEEHNFGQIKNKFPVADLTLVRE